MTTLVLGGSGSGKSAYAENYIKNLSGEKKKYYIATMKVFDEEGQKKVERHKKLREGKGFVTIEQPLSINRALEKMEPGEKNVLLECISNLTANEMFAEEIPKSVKQVADKILEEIRQLKENTDHLVIVSNNVFEDGIVYDKTTMEYGKAMGIINQGLAHMAEEVVEVVVGIPVFIKKGPA